MSRHGISRKTGYKWLVRHRANGVAGLRDLFRRPHTHPNRSWPDVEKAVVRVCEEHPVWGSRKTRLILQNED